MTFAVTIEHTMDTAEGEFHWCDTEYVEAEDLGDAREKVVINDMYDHLIAIQPAH